MPAPPQGQQQHACAECGNPAAFMCSSCGDRVSYCSPACQEKNWPQHRKKPSSSQQQTGNATAAAASTAQPARSAAEGDPADDTQSEANLQEDLPYYTNQVYRLILPIMACIALSILWTKVSMSGSFRPTSAWTVYSETPSASAGQQLAGGFMNAGIIIGQIIAMTFVLFLLFKFNCMKVIYGVFALVMIIVLGFTGYMLSLSLIQVSGLVIDQITLYFGLFNFAVVGIVAIFWRAPPYVQQIYLVLMSSLMAFQLTGLQEWTTWVLLGLLAIWDLFAVLSPYGPLRLLVEHTRRNNQNMNMLVYSVGAMLWFMATPREPRSPGSPFSGLDKSASDASIPAGSIKQLPLEGDLGSVDHIPLVSLGNTAQLADARVGNDSSAQLPGQVLAGTESAGHTVMTNTPAVVPVQQAFGLDEERPASTSPPGDSAPEGEEEEEDDEQNGLKLGLGDFVFYSVLTARAAMSDWVTTIACIIAVTTGMTMTIFILAIFQKPLPALPISIAFGMLFYFVSSITLQPFLQSVLLAQVVV
ncbi:hypothetical protein RI367_008332 [Sorochytrium milnesiophthora]